jgi:hypothetical protein
MSAKSFLMGMKERQLTNRVTESAPNHATQVFFL